MFMFSFGLRQPLWKGHLITGKRVVTHSLRITGLEKKKKNPVDLYGRHWEVLSHVAVVSYFTMFQGVEKDLNGV